MFPISRTRTRNASTARATTAMASLCKLVFMASFVQRLARTIDELVNKSPERSGEVQYSTPKVSIAFENDPAASGHNNAGIKGKFQNRLTFISLLHQITKRK